MDRRLFLKQFGMAGLGMPILSGSVQEFFSKPVKIYDNYVRGLQYYDYKKLKEDIKAGDELILQRDTENMHDSFAVSVIWQGQKLGYLPAYENIVTANIMDAGVDLNAFVSAHNRGTSYFSRLSIAIYAKLVVSRPQIIQPKDLRADERDDIYRLR
jgi:hypothetical protein